MSNIVPTNDPKPATGKRWKCWVVGITDRRPDFLDGCPTIVDQKKALVRSVREHFHLKSDEAAARLAEQMGLKLALVSPDEAVVSFARFTDLEQSIA